MTKVYRTITSTNHDFHGFGKEIQKNLNEGFKVVPHTLVMTPMVGQGTVFAIVILEREEVRP